jgi:hypothetical protein
MSFYILIDRFPFRTPAGAVYERESIQFVDFFFVIVRYVECDII